MLENSTQPAHQSSLRLDARGDMRIVALSVLFVLSGFCGLIYESIWSHYLKLFVGHAAYAQTVVLVVFIGGMALGAALVGKIADRVKFPLLWYAAVEATVGLISLVFHKLFVSVTAWGYAVLLPATCVPESPCISQWALAAALILPQSILLGTTFPLMTAGVLRLAPSFPGRKIAQFYFLNSIGAVVGVLASAFVLIPAVGLPGALLTAGLMNIAVAIGAYSCNRGTVARRPVGREASGASADSVALNRVLLAVAALTGLSSFVYEIAWIRMLSLVIGASTDAFELMLAAFILGLALGGLWVKRHVDGFRDILKVLAIVQVLMGVAAIATLPIYDATFDLLAWLLHSLARSSGGYALYNLASHGIALLVMLPATFLAGMTLPLITTALLRGKQGERAIGFVYAANTLGAIVGVIVAVHLALPALGLKGTLILGAGIDVALGTLLFLSRGGRSGRWQAVGWTAAGLGALTLVGVLAPMSPERLASGVYRHGVPSLADNMSFIYSHVGKTANVDVLSSPHTISIRTNGKSDASIAHDPTKPTPDEHTMAFTALLPLAYKPDSHHIAVIGFGSGMTTATLLASPVVKRVDTIEIEPAMVEGARLFGNIVEAAYTDSRSRIVIDDAKSYFARSREKYDLILSEPSNPWVSGVASLFTSEFYRQIQGQLVPGGLFVQWIQAYEFSDELMGTILQALEQEFEDFVVYSSNGGDMILLASTGRLPSPSASYMEFPALSQIARRLNIDSLDEIEARRLAGAASIRSMLSAMRVSPNSDYYPLVDHGAPKARFTQSEARGLGELPLAPIPVIEMVEGRQAAIPDRIGTGRSVVPRRDMILAAQATARWLLTGDAALDASLPRDIGLLRAHLWQCAPLPGRLIASEMLLDVAGVVNTQLSSANAAEVWKAIRSAPCFRQLDAETIGWVELFEAVGARDSIAMAVLGNRQLERSKAMKRSRFHRYALLSAAVGMITSSQKVAARELLAQELGTLPAGVSKDSLYLMLRGLSDVEGIAAASAATSTGRTTGAN